MNGMTHEEAGASDNRLMIEPDAFGGIAKEWEDGQEYEVTVKLRQTSPGEFQVLSMTEAPHEEATETEGAAEEESGGPAPPRGNDEENPAVARMMRGPKGY